jgi:uncharacterized membrane protein
MHPLGLLHLSASIVALLTGAVVLLRRKGNATHRRIGWVYVVSMVAMNVTALMIYRLTRSFGPFHIAAMVSLGSLMAGIIPAWRRLPKNGWLDRHYSFMCYSYLGLTAAAVAEIASRVPAVQAFGGGPTPAFWSAVAVASFVVFAVGIVLIQTRATRVKRPFAASLGS